MKTPLVYFIAISAIVACAAQPTTISSLWLDGSTPEQELADDNECMVKALRDAPRSLASSTSPTYVAPSNVQCVNYGNFVNCQELGGQVFGGQSTTVDLNSELRNNLYAQCMGEKGWSLVQFPICRQEQLAMGVTPRSRNASPNRVDVICVLEDSSGYVLR